MDRSAISKYLNRYYTSDFTEAIIDKFEYKLGRDVSKYILDFIKPLPVEICCVCLNITNNKFMYCNNKECYKKICGNCCSKTIKYNKFIPFCNEHFNNTKRKNKKKLIKLINKYAHKYNVQFLHYMFKRRNHNQIMDNVFHYDSNMTKYIPMPKRKHINSKFHLYIDENMLVVKLADNIYDCLEFEDEDQILLYYHE
jgi:hypothetical protein